MIDLTGIKNLLFDFGGVIASISKTNAIKRFKEIGVDDIENYLGEFAQKGIFLDIETGKLSREGFYQELRQLTGKNISDKDIDSGWLAFMVEVPEYKLQLLKSLRKKYNMYLLSNTNPIVMEWACSKNFSKDGEPLSNYFDQMFLSYQIGNIKPSKVAFEAVISGAKIKPEETLFLDDGQSNTDMAKEFGFRTYLVNQDEDLRKIFE